MLCGSVVCACVQEYKMQLFNVHLQCTIRISNLIFKEQQGKGIYVEYDNRIAQFNGGSMNKKKPAAGYPQHKSHSLMGKDIALKTVSIRMVVAVRWATINRCGTNTSTHMYTYINPSIHRDAFKQFGALSIPPYCRYRLNVSVSCWAH